MKMIYSKSFLIYTFKDSNLADKTEKFGRKSLKKLNSVESVDIVCSKSEQILKCQDLEQIWFINVFISVFWFVTLVVIINLVEPQLC